MTGELSTTKQKIIKEYKDREHFYKCFVESLVVYEPLDRMDPEECNSMNNKTFKTVAALKE